MESLRANLTPPIGRACLAVAAALLAMGCESAAGGALPDAASGGIDFVADTVPGPNSGADSISTDTVVAIGSDSSVAPETTEDSTGPDLPPGPCSIDGTGCNDGDACTGGDACQGGTCVGVPVVCDDKLVCTLDTCVEGACKSAVTAGFCLINGACYATGTQSPGNPCLKCDPATVTGAWTEAEGPCATSAACGGSGTCSQGQCVSTGPACPEDSNPCTVATCGPTGCTQVPTVGPCDDGNACTTGDACNVGICIPGTSPCPDDGNPCTDVTCAGGICGTSPKIGPCDDGSGCTIGDACSASTCLPGAAKDADQDGEVDSACGGTDCSDQSNAVGKTKKEVCTDTIDNDCDGKADKADSDCTIAFGSPCQYHADCHPLGVCAAWSSAQEFRCSGRCAGASDCVAGEMCTRLPGSMSLGFCEPAPIGGQTAGTACTAGSQCASGLCFESVCRATCLEQSKCSLGQVCAFYATADGGIASFCEAPSGIATGQLCQVPGQPGVFDGSVCATGLCDLAPDDPSLWRCAPLCTSENDCASGQECALMGYAVPPDGLPPPPLAAPYHPEFTTPTYDGVTGCYTNQLSGIAPFLNDGSPCQADQFAYCKSNKCMGVGPEGAYRCTTYCTKDADCTLGMKCKTVPLTLVSEYLVIMAQYGGQPISLDAFSYTQVCSSP